MGDFISFFKEFYVPTHLSVEYISQKIFRMYIVLLWFGVADFVFYGLKKSLGG
jgi:hypothetical protein